LTRRIGLWLGENETPFLAGRGMGFCVLRQAEIDLARKEGIRMSQEFQEFIIKTEQGKRCITRISERIISGPFRGHFQWTHFECKDPTDEIFHPKTINPALAKPFKDPVSVLEAMLLFIIKELEKDKDKIKFLDNPGDCELVSLESQKEIVKRLRYVFAIKVKGE
jgi:hypothetical protein